MEKICPSNLESLQKETVRKMRSPVSTVDAFTVKTFVRSLILYTKFQFWKRWFMLEGKLPLCGHTTLAHAGVLFQKLKALICHSDRATKASFYSSHPQVTQWTKASCSSIYSNVPPQAQ